LSPSRRALQGVFAMEENPTQNLCIDGYIGLLKRAGLETTHIIDAPFLVMKGMALDDRLKEKDAWDIYYCIQNYPGGLDHLIGEFRPYIEHGLVKEGLEKIAKHFASEKHVGPRFVADFEEITDPEERELRERDAYEKVGYILQKLGIV